MSEGVTPGATPGSAAPLHGAHPRSIVVAVGNDERRAACVAAASGDPRLHLVMTTDAVTDPRLRGLRPDVAVVGGDERGVLGLAATTVARRLFRDALIVPITEDDDPAGILELAARLASEGPAGPSQPALTLEDVRRAIDGGHPTVVFQPVFDLQDRRLIGVEALARFHLDPASPPDVWFAAAARVGLGLELERIAVRRAIEAADALPRDVYLAVNVSPALVLAPGFDELLADTRAVQLVLEITEHAQVDDYEALRTALKSVRAKGVRIAIDDVGAGFATLRHVLRLDPEIIKLDCEITSGVEHDPGRAKLVGGLIAGASAVSTLVIAEGIETSDQLGLLRDLGARGGQGYFLALPTDLQSVLAMGNLSPTTWGPTRSHAPPTPVARRALSGARILVVDDSPALRQLIGTVLELEGAAVHEADTVAAALAALDQVAPDLVLLDVRLPDGTGFDVLEHIRRTGDVPVLFVTAATAVSDRVAGIDRGADDYMLKPFSPEELVARADAAMRRRLAIHPVVPPRGERDAR
jgi:EAL domain-containing protein (putative c-di-GMP-specific phosphodiesterase class I)/CheY-like chemotaxis protein